LRLKRRAAVVGCAGVHRVESLRGLGNAADNHDRQVRSAPADQRENGEALLPFGGTENESELRLKQDARAQRRFAPERLPLRGQRARELRVKGRIESQQQDFFSMHQVSPPF
jgi:hypothetical protein